MGDISIIARRLKSGHIQYGWSGNGGYYKNVGVRLLDWYNQQDDNQIERLFHLGQLKRLGMPDSERGGQHWFYTHWLTGEPHYVGTTEMDIFSTMAYVDHGYFYDLDKHWYYIVPKAFRIKIPLELIAQNVDDQKYEFIFLDKLQRMILQYIFTEYPEQDKVFAEILKGVGGTKIYKQLNNMDYPIYEFWENYQRLFQYFDNWVVVETDVAYKSIISFKMKKKGEKHVETIDW